MKATRTRLAQLGSLSAMLLSVLAVSGCALSAAHKAYLLDLQHQQVKAMVQAKAQTFEPLELSEIEHLVQKQVPDEQILYHLRRGKAVYQLTTNDVERLRKAGVSGDIIDFMLSTARRYAPIYYYPPPYYYSPYYCPPYYYYGPYPYYRGGGGIRAYPY